MNFLSTPSFFRSGPPRVVRLSMAVAASATLLFAEGHFDMMEQARAAASLVLYPVQRAVNMPGQAIRYVSDFLSSKATLQQENTALRIRQLAMAAQLSRLITLQRELDELRLLNGIKAHYQPQATLVDTLSNARDPFSHKIIVDKGRGAYLQVGLPVVDGCGLLGQITRVHALTAEVTLLRDKNHLVPVMVARTGRRAILYGSGGGVEIRYFPQSEDIQVGDDIVTSGLDSFYPAGIPVARVNRVERNQGSTFIRITLSPLAGVQQTRYLLVLGNKQPPLHPVGPISISKKSGKATAAQE